MLGALAALNPVAAIGSALSIGESALAYKGQKDTNQANERIARENREFQADMVSQAQDFEERMSNSAYQRAMDDMRSAGLNPMLAYQQGGASTPIGKTAPGSTAVMQNPGMAAKGFSQGFLSAVSTSADVNMKGSQASYFDELRWKTYHEIDKVKADTDLSRDQSDQIAELVKKIGQETQGIKADNVQRKIIADFLESSEFAAMAKYIGVTPQALGTIIRGVFFNKRRR